MIKFLKNPLLVAILILSVFAVSCNKNDKPTPVTPPKIKSLSKLEGLIGSSVTIMGTNLKNVDRVRFGAKDAAAFNASNNSDTAITVQVPAGVSYGNLLLQVYITGVGSDQANFKVIEPPRPPTITGAAAPATGYPGTAVTLTGTNLEIINQVKFGSVVAVFTSTPTTLTTSVPASAVAGDQLITVSGPGGNATTSFNVSLAPVITSMTPLTGSAGTLITVNGVRFTGTTSVKLGSLNVTPFTLVNDTKITFAIPATGVSGKVTVTTPNGSGISADNLVVQVAGFALMIYDDVLQGGFGVWGGWNGSIDMANTTPVKSGSKSIKVTYAGGYGSPLQWGGANINLAPYTTLKISLYGGPGTTGKKVKIVFSHDDTHGKELILQAGVWTDYTIPISEITSLTVLNEFWLQEFSGADEIVYVDDVGLN
jgi:IPT/TIG domain